jgi:sorting nexin-17
LAQHETSGEKVEKRNIAVYLPNGHRLSFDVWNNESTSSLLAMVADELKLRADWIHHFSIFMFRRNSNGTWSVLRKLGDYESPYVSLSWKTSDFRLVLRKCNWDNSKDEMLMDDRVGLHLLYVQTVSDIENGWISVPKEHLKALTVLQSRGEKVEYLRHARQLKFYGTIKFSSCQSSFVNPGSLLAVYIGNREIIFVTSERQEVVFKLTRVKCWRISLVHETRGIKAELSFEYLTGNDKLEWFSIVSEEAVLMASCLQEMVADMVAKQQPSIPSKAGASWFGSSVYVRRDGGKVQLNGSPAPRNPVPVSAVYRPNPSNSSNRVLENSVFLGIGDDDL